MGILHGNKSSQRAIGVSVCGDCWAEGCPITVLARCVAATPSWATSMARESVTGHVTCESDGEVLMIYIYILHILLSIISIYIYISAYTENAASTTTRIEAEIKGFIVS